MRQSNLFDDGSSPQLFRPISGRPSLLESIGSRTLEIKQQLLEHGALLFRGFLVSDVTDFDAVVQHISKDHLKYMYRSTPRSSLSERVYTATNYPARLEIPLHNENAYQRNWPLTVAFCCVLPPDRGGETPIANMTNVRRAIDPTLFDKFANRGVEYIRHYHENVDLSWQVVFQTDNREVLQKYCDENGIRWEWLPDGLLRTSHTAQGVAKHPVLGNDVFFNQAHLFHVSSLGAERSRAVKSLFGEDRLPRHARFGDGSEITFEDLDHIRLAFDKSMATFRWEMGDVLLLDNMQFAHGRKPFEGRRTILAALMDPHCPNPM